MRDTRFAGGGAGVNGCVTEGGKGWEGEQGAGGTRGARHCEAMKKFRMQRDPLLSWAFVLCEALRRAVRQGAQMGRDQL